MENSGLILNKSINKDIADIQQPLSNNLLHRGFLANNNISMRIDAIFKNMDINSSQNYNVNIKENNIMKNLENNFKFLFKTNCDKNILLKYNKNIIQGQLDFGLFGLIKGVNTYIINPYIILKTNCQLDQYSYGFGNRTCVSPNLENEVILLGSSYYRN